MKIMSINWRRVSSFLFFVWIFGSSSAWSQKGELVNYKSKRDSINAEISKLKKKLKPLEKESNTLKSKIEILQGWNTGTFGTIGFNQAAFNNWVKGRNPNATSTTIRGAFNGFANKKTEKSFWRNAGILNLGWQRLDIDTEEGDDPSFEKTTDILKITSLYGRNITKKIAFSAQGEYNTAILTNINNPGILDLGTGITWNPRNNLVVTLHPLNYHWVFGDSPEFENALGSKVTVDYVQKFPYGITWRSNLTGFVPYNKQDPSLREYNWVNGLSFSAWKAIGVGMEYAVRNAGVEFDGVQSYFVLGLSYNL
jgi:hypothetical protein